LNGGIAALGTSTLSLGLHTITGTFSGDPSYNSVTSSGGTLNVMDFSLNAGGNTLSSTVLPGTSTSYTFPISPIGGPTMPGAITFSASGLPSGTIATFSPATLAAGSGTTIVTLTIQVPQVAALERGRQSGRSLPLAAVGILLLPFFSRMRRSSKSLRRVAWVLLLASAGAMAGLGGCGGTPPQMYSIGVTATSGALSHSTTVVTLTVL
jgi:hypothetical protein